MITKQEPIIFCYNNNNIHRGSKLNDKVNVKSGWLLGVFIYSSPSFIYDLCFHLYGAVGEVGPVLITPEGHIFTWKARKLNSNLGNFRDGFCGQQSQCFVYPVNDYRQVDRLYQPHFDLGCLGCSFFFCCFSPGMDNTKYM